MKIVVFEGVYETKEASTKETYRYEYEKDYKPDMVNVAYVKIDEKIFRFEEDPSDGYRSYCEESIVDKAPKGAKFNFQDHPVLVGMRQLDGETLSDEDNYDPTEVRDFRGLVIFSPRDKKTVLGVFGTDNVGDYYPGCRMYMDIANINAHCIPNTEAGKVIYDPEEN